MIKRPQLGDSGLVRISEHLAQPSENVYMFLSLCMLSFDILIDIFS